MVQPGINALNDVLNSYNLMVSLSYISVRNVGCFSVALERGYSKRRNYFQVNREIWNLFKIFAIKI